MNDQEYFDDREYVRFGWLEDFRYSPAYFHAKYITGEISDKPSDAMILGSVIHCMLLEPQEFHTRYAVAPKVDRRTKDGKATWEDFSVNCSLRNLSVVPAEIAERAEVIVEHARENQNVNKLLGAARAVERVVKWSDTESSLRCKCKVDASVMPDTGVPTCLVDIKTTTDPYPDSFSRAMANRGYHRQAGWYTWGCELAYGIEDLPFAFIAIGTEPPYESFVYQLPERVLTFGREQNRRTLDQLAECYRTNQWSHPDTQTVRLLDLPQWAYTQQQIEVEA